jgi:hypothetical protein
MTTHPHFPGLPLRFVFLFYHQLRVLALVTIIDNVDPRISYLPSFCSNTDRSSSSTCNAPWYVEALLCSQTRFVLAD